MKPYYDYEGVTIYNRAVPQATPASPEFFRINSPSIPEPMARARFATIHCGVCCDRSVRCGCECSPCLIAVKSELLRSRVISANA